MSTKSWISAVLETARHGLPVIAEVGKSILRGQSSEEQQRKVRQKIRRWEHREFARIREEIESGDDLG